MKKEILIITGTLGGGGAEKVLENTLNYWNYDKYNVTLLVVCDHHHYYNINKNVNIVFLNKFVPHSYFGYLLHFHKLTRWYFECRIKSLFYGKRYDAIISFSEGSALICHSLVMDKTENNISWVHCDMSKFLWCRFMFESENEIKDIYRRMSSVVCVSESSMNAFIARFGEMRQLSHIYNLIDKEVIRAKAEEFAITKKNFTVVSCGRLMDVKRFDRVINVAKIIKERGYSVEFWILGKGELESRLKTLVDNYKLSDSVYFFGFQSNPYPFIRACDIFLVTSDTEAYPTVICEALCLGKTIVSTPVPGCVELIKDDVGIVSEFDNQSIANDLERLIKSENLISQYENKAKEKGDTFQPTEIMKSIYDLIEK